MKQTTIVCLVFIVSLAVVCIYTAMGLHNLWEVGIFLIWLYNANTFGWLLKRNIDMDQEMKQLMIEREELLTEISRVVAEMQEERREREIRDLLDL